MLITSIQIQNFLCYFGIYEDNTFNFSPGLNIIIGDNNSGKSKLYDAFRWVIHDRVFDSSIRDSPTTSVVKDKIVSDRAKFEAEIDSSISTKIKICLIRKEHDHLAYYELERAYHIRKTAQGFNQLRASTLKTKRSDILLTPNLSLYEDFKKGEKILTAETKLQPVDVDEVLKKIVNTGIEKFLWFQGEQVDSLVDFNKEDSIKAMINQLSDIDQYDKLTKAITPHADEAETQFRRLAKRTKNHKLDSLSEQLEDLEKKITSRQTELSAHQIEKESLSQQKEKFVSRQSDSIEIIKLANKKSKKEEKLKQLKKEVKDTEASYHNNLFDKYWVLEGLGKHIAKFSKIKSQYTENRINTLVDLRADQKNNLQRLPADIPNEAYLTMMLKDCKCYLCNRDFEQGDEVYKTIEHKANQNKNETIPDTTFVFEDNFEQLAQGLKYTVGTNRIKEIGSDIESVDQELYGKKEAIIKLEKEIDKIDADIQKYTKGEDKEMLISQGHSFSLISRDYRNVDEKISTLQEEIPDYKVRAEYTKKEYNKEYDKQPKNKEMKAIEEKKDILRLFARLAKKTRDNVYSDLIEKLEKEVNKHFHKMTMGNKGALGQVKFDINHSFIRPLIVDSNGVELSSVNDSNIILVKLATIMGVITTKSADLPLPLISDAPTSKFGDNYTLNFCRQVSNVFPQSIIMSYDFHQNIKLRDELLKSTERIGFVYEITPAQVNSNNQDRNGLFTKITCLKNG
jgi:DNA sulfur modification protein DndD